MGSGQSRNLDYASNASSTTLRDADENVFEVNFDDLFFTSEFHSDLLQVPEDERKITISPPNENIVADIMTDPTAFASVQTNEEAWLEVLAPLFTGNDRTKPFINQLYSAMFRFFNDRPNKFFEDEENRQLGIMENLNAEKPLINRHYNLYEGTKISINDDFINSLNSYQSIVSNSKLKSITSLPDFNKIPLISSNPLYNSVSTKFKEILNNFFTKDDISSQKNDIERMIMYIINWGFYASDISCVIEGLMSIFKLLISTTPNSKFAFPVQHYSEMLYNSISLTNSINIIPINPRSVVIPNFSLPKNPSCSLVACDGKKVYIIGRHGHLHFISLNKGIVNNTTRFHTIQLNMIPKKERVMMGIAISQGYAFINGPYMSKPYVFKLPSFEQVKDVVISSSKIRAKNKLTPPFTSDGQFIYSLNTNKQKISVYVIQPPKIQLQRVIPIKLDDTQNMTTNQNSSIINADSDKIPPIPKNKNIPIFTNGTVLTLVLLDKEMNGQFFYIMRHFSLIDGTHIGDNYHIQKWPLFSILYDPWNRVYWELSPEKEKSFLLKLPNYSAQPLWLSGWLTNPTQQSYLEILNSIGTAKNLKGLFTSMSQMISFLSAQFHGCSFKAISSSNINTTHFVSPCTPEVVKSIISAANYYIELLDISNTNSKFIKKIETVVDLNFIRTILFSYLGILNYNLSNFETRVIKNQTIQLSQKDINEIVDFLYSILQNDCLSFLHRSVAFIFSNSFSLIMKEPSQKISSIFKKMYLTLPHNIITSVLSKIDNNQMFPYLIQSKDVRELFHPVLKNIALSNQIPNELEFISSFMRTMMLELRKVYTQNQIDIPQSARSLSNTFYAFANLMSEETDTFLKRMITLYHEETFKFHPFVRLLSKWLIMLEPLTQFNRLSTEFTAFLNVFLRAYTSNLDKIKANPNLRPDGKGYSAIYMIYYEIFSEYLNFLSALLNGGTELKEAIQYLWLIKSTIDGKVTPSDINSLVENIKNKDKSTNHPKKQLLSKGFSFNINQKESMDKRLVVDFVSNLTLQKESVPIKALMDYLYKKVNNPLNKRLNDEQRWIERLILGAFSKQLGVTSILFNISLQVTKNEVPVLSPFIKQILESIYKIRRNLALSRQKTNQFRARCEQDMTPPVTDKLEENYEEFMNQIIKKAVFLLHIEPCLQFQSVKFEEDFPLMLKNLTFFTTSTITVENYFKLITASNNSRMNVATGIQLIIDFLKTNKNIYCNYYLIDKFSSSGDIVNFLSTLEASSRDQGIKLIIQLMQILKQLIVDNNNSVISANSIIVLYANLILSIAKISKDAVFEPLSNLLEELTKTHSGQVFRSYLSFLGSVMTILYETIPEFAKSPEFLSLIRRLFPSKEIAENMLPIARICYKAGLDLQIDYLSIMNILKNCSSSYYHSLSTFLTEVFHKSNEKIRFLSIVMKEISLSISGANSIIMKDFPYFDESINNNSISNETENKCKSANLICSCLSELIQFCRRILISGDENGELLKNIFDFILSTYSPISIHSTTNTFDNEIISSFQDKIYCYSVFSILSNSIDDIHINSILKNEEDNTIYYIDSIDQLNQRYFVWKLPITKDSEIISIDFSSKYIPVSILPFATSMYLNYKLLIPFFLKSLSENHSNPLDILILMTFKEYSSDSNFLNEFIPIFSKEFLSPQSLIKLENISFIDTSNYFQTLLYSHLRQNSKGFNEVSDQFPQFYCFSPYNYSVKAEITKSNIECGNDIHMFITSPVSLKMKSTLTASIAKCKNFQIGLYCLSTYESGADYILLSCINGKFQLYSNFFSRFITKDYNSNDSIVIKYVPQLGTSIFINDKKIDIDEMKSEQNPISFLIITYENASINYSIKTEFTSSSNFSTDSKNDSPAPSFAPFAGKAVFVRKNQNKFDLFSKNKKEEKTTNLNELKSIFKKNTRSLINHDFKVDFESFKTQQSSMIEEQVGYVGNQEQNDIIIYSEQITSQISDKINILPNVDLCRYIPESEMLYSTIRQENSIDINDYQADNLHAFVPDGDDRLIYSNKTQLMKFINKFTGTIEESNKTTIRPNSIPLITLQHYSILPPKIINHFSTSYLRLIRNESISSYMIKCIATTNQIEPILELISKINEDKSLMFILIQIVIRLFVLLEPINIKVGLQLQCPIDFDFDVLQMPPRLPQLHLYLSALQKILDYVKSDKERLNEFTEEWFKVLKNQFHDGFSHSAQPNHPHVIMRTFSKSKTNTIFSCTKPYSTIRENIKWVIVRVGFVNPQSEEPAFKQTNLHRYNFEQDNNDETDSLLSCQNSLQFEFNKEKGTYAAIPYINNNNDTLNGTFFDLIISMKYFANFVNKNSDQLNSIKLYRTKLHSFFFESLIARSPFFVKYSSHIFHYLNDKLVICGSDIKGEYVKSINLLAIYYGRDIDISSYLLEQETLYNEQSLIPIKTFYPAFQTPADIVQIKEYFDEQKQIHGDGFSANFEVPLNVISNNYDSNCFHSIIVKTVNNIRRIFKSNQDRQLVGYPFHFLLEDWIYLSQLVPPFETSTVLPAILKVHFNFFTPKYVSIHFNWLSKLDAVNYLTLSISKDSKMNSDWQALSINDNKTKEFAPPDQTFYIKISITKPEYSGLAQWSNIAFTIFNTDTKYEIMKNANLYALQHTKEFVNDVRLLATQWEPSNTQSFLDCLVYSQIKDDKLNLNNILFNNIDKFMTKKAITIANESIPLHARLLHGKFMIILNWLITNNLINLKQTQNKVFMPYVWKQLKIVEFKHKISSNSITDNEVDLRIDRKGAGDIRLGISTNLSKTIINQMSSFYRHSDGYRVMSDRPWSVKFVNEEGIDAGGPARELVGECAADFCCPLCGLVVPTPNARNDVGDYKDCVIPIANPAHLMIQKQYETAGAMMAIAARSDLVQSFNFPPLVWEFLVTGEIPSINLIFDIDDVYKSSITSLQEAMKSDMSEDEFASRFKMKFVVNDSTGKEVPLTQRGKTESVTMSNCGLYISLANNFRINEMKENLESMRKGMWQNFNFEPPPSLDGSTLEFACCGQKEITTEILKKVTEFREIDEERQEMFWRVVEEFTPAERSLLLKFATARVNLPPQITESTTLLYIDDANSVNRCPTASTCFHRLHLPDYTSFESAYRLIKMAIECTGTFELM